MTCLRIKRLAYGPWLAAGTESAVQDRQATHDEYSRSSKIYGYHTQTGPNAATQLHPGAEDEEEDIVFSGARNSVGSSSADI